MLAVFITFCGLAWGIVNCRAQVWPHMDAIESSSAVPGLFSRLGRTNLAWGIEVNGLQLGVALSKDVYAPNESVQALITLTNSSATRAWARRDYERGGMTSLELILLHGKELVKSRYECDRSPVYFGSSSHRGTVLRPGGKTSDGVSIDVQFHLEPNKLYHLYAIRKAAIGTNEFMVTSGNVSFMITNGVPATGTKATAANVPPHALASAAPAIQASASLTPPKREPVGPREAPTVASKSMEQGRNSAAPTRTELKTTPAVSGVLGSSIGLVGWLLLGVPLAVLLWILGRAASRARPPKA